MGVSSSSSSCWGSPGSAQWSPSPSCRCAQSPAWCSCRCSCARHCAPECLIHLNVQIPTTSHCENVSKSLWFLYIDFRLTSWCWWACWHRWPPSQWQRHPPRRLALLQHFHFIDNVTAAIFVTSLFSWQIGKLSPITAGSSVQAAFITSRRLS